MGNNKKNNKKKQGKVFDKTMIWATAIIVAVTAVVMGAILLPDPIMASVRLGEAKDFVRNASVENISVTAPLESDGVFEDKNFKLTGDEAKDMAETVKTIIENSKYSKTFALQKEGVWLTNLILYTADDEYKIYIDGEAYYIESGNKLIRYIPDNDHAELYDEFCNKIAENLEKTEETENK